MFRDGTALSCASVPCSRPSSSMVRQLHCASITLHTAKPEYRSIFVSRLPVFGQRKAIFVRRETCFRWTKKKAGLSTGPMS
ncbi:hypothetical protein SJA_C2-00070 [Sphingobium indicum UT26S]|uniref:Uncharacterized protein n=1 Tax=Sphingobium indicum (strain DSM 16413 / CCM 7287 / MTCC 6362 / UT26 / NBRC 101211 / UT26S) TaxID=452662 RepID=D4Z7A1_SPHIU|nr:hypothetical protein SJA_C2-00070 [Sphingobium indicum UT26S]